MAIDEGPIRALARSRHGIVGWSEARAFGFTPRSIRVRLDRGSWSRVGQALVVRDLLKPGDTAVAWALHLHAGARSVVSGPLAARLQGWSIGGDDHILINPSPVRSPAGWDVTVIRRGDQVATQPEGQPPLTPLIDALADIVTRRSEREARDLIDQALQQRWIDANAMEEMVITRSGRGRKGSTRLRALLDRASTGSRSEAEQRMGALLSRTSGNWIANYPVRDESGRTLAEIDFADPHVMIAIEVDGRAFHSDRRSFERDRERQNMIALHGWLILRFTWERIVDDPDGVIAEVKLATGRSPR
jgi:hypothetical protein